MSFTVTTCGTSHCQRSALGCSQYGKIPACAYPGQGPSCELCFQGNLILEGYQEAGVFIGGLNRGFLLVFLGAWDR